MKTDLRLPQLDVCFESEAGASPDLRQILVLGGRPPAVSWLRAAASGKTVWAADSGVDACRLAGVCPAHVIGDFDSIGEDGRRWIESLDIRPELYPADKDYTDFQLCLNRIRGELLVTGCWGGRFDHAFGNVFSLFWGRELGADIRAFADEREVLLPVFGESTARIFFREPLAALSLLPLTSVCRGVSISDVKWELHDVELQQGRPWTLSNLPLKNRATVRVRQGTPGVYCLF